MARMRGREGVLLLLLLVACPEQGDGESAAGAASATAEQTAKATASATASVAVTTTADATAAPTTAAAATSNATAAATSDPVASAACPEDMVLAKGRYCPKVKHVCDKHTKEYEEAQSKRARLLAQGQKPGPLRAVERCLRYRKPATCMMGTVPLRFCIDRYEWPNRVGEKPSLLVSWTEAKSLCEAKGKRLCTADEFNFACEGEEMLPYSYGFERDPSRCNIDKPYVTPGRERLLPEPVCNTTPWCAAELSKLDQRAPIGSTRDCTSPFGAHDLNGNVNEWVVRQGVEPKRSGLKGGWWGPARSRCRPMVTAHDENYVGYEVGFRCCKAASD